MTKKQYDEIVRAARESVDKMTVQQMRLAAKGLGIKSASKYRRPQLTEMVVDKMVEQTIENVKKMDEVAKKVGKVKKSIKGSNKDIGHDVQVIGEYLEKAYNGDVGSRDDVVQHLMTFGRQVLIRAMKYCKVKGWYRIYDKPTMVSRIVEVIGA